MPTTPRRQHPYPAGAGTTPPTSPADPVDVPGDLQALALSVDNVAIDLQGTAGARPAAGAVDDGTYYFATDTGVLSRSDGAAWTQITAAAPPAKTFQVPHTWALSGPVAVPVGQTDYVPPFRVPVKAGDTVKLVRVEYRLANGAAGITVSFKLQRNGADIAGFGTTGAPLVTPNSANWAETDPADVALADLDSLELVVTAIAGAPQNLSVSAILEHSV